MTCKDQAPGLCALSCHQQSLVLVGWLWSQHRSQWRSPLFLTTIRAIVAALDVRFQVCKVSGIHSLRVEYYDVAAAIALCHCGAACCIRITAAIQAAIVRGWGCCLVLRRLQHGHAGQLWRQCAARKRFSRTNFFTSEACGVSTATRRSASSQRQRRAFPSISFEHTTLMLCEC